MDQKNKYLSFVAGIFFLAVMSLISSASAEDLASVYSVEGSLEIQHKGASTWEKVDTGKMLLPGDVLRTSGQSRAGILFSDGVLVRLNENSVFQLENPKEAEQPVSLFSGIAYFFNRDPKKVPVVKTPVVSASVRGTEFVVAVENNKTVVSVLDGEVECSNSFGAVVAKKGEQSETLKGKAPTKSILLNPLDAVQWALKYPSLEEVDDFGGRISSQGDSGKHIYRASRYLSVGDVKGARSELEAAHAGIKKISKESQSKIEALYNDQMAIINLVANEKQKAREFADLAVSKDDKSQAAHLARSYVYQSDFKLKAARKEIEGLVKVNENNSFLLTRLGELQLSEGNIEGGSSSIKSALAISPDNSYTLTMYGFSKLIRDEVSDAKTYFDRAVSKDSSAALPRLGLGLSLIRTGELEAGRQEIQTAVHLEPSVSVYRSYLGKAFYEEDREKMARHEYDRAIDLDPKDPTPYLYRAFNSLSQNRPVEALSDVETSIEKNNNRAVYRSSFYLDQDLAVRSAGLANVFNALGFWEAARVEAIKSLNKDYGNYSAHRLLGNSYQTLLLAEAGLSEKRVSDLLAPLSFNLFQDSGGETSVNDYNALFDRDESRTSISGDLSTQNDFLNGSFSESGRSGKFGYFAGITTTAQNGSKGGTYYRRSKFRFAGQYQPTYKDRLVGDLKVTTQNHRDSLENSATSVIDLYEGSIGYHRRLAANSKVLAQAAFQRSSSKRGGFDTRTVNIDALLDEELIQFVDELGLHEFARESGVSGLGSVQYLLDEDFATIVFGGDYFAGSFDRRERSDILGDTVGIFTEPGQQLRSDAGQEPTSGSVYEYTTFHPVQWADITTGVSFTTADVAKTEIVPFIDDQSSFSHWNPKAGVTFYPTSDLMIRTAYFESLRKAVIEDFPGIEPTLVGGMNQVFGDLPGARARNFGGGLDYKIARSTYVGVEGIRRHVVQDITVTQSEVSLGDNLEVTDTLVSKDMTFGNHKDQDITRGYFYQILTDRLVSNLEYRWSRFENTGDPFTQTIDTQQAGGTLRYFSPYRWFASLGGTWREQKLDQSFLYDDGINDFWVVDFGLGYRLPNRHGTLAAKVNNVLNKDFVYDQFLGSDAFIRPERSFELVFSTNF